MMIDFRSDTVTRPTPAMRQAMSVAEVGDDVYDDDVTVNRFQATIADRAGKEAALFFPTGTQSNLAALMTHCQRGDEYIAGQGAHLYRYEGGGAAVLGSVQPQPVEHAEDGSLPIHKIAAAIKPLDFHFARTRLLALENTHHGKVIDQSYIVKATDMVHARGLATHLDGARVMNAAVASGLALNTVLKPFDSVSVCFSKGLGAPVGSVLLGSQAFIDDARRWRKVLGGGMRQSGVLAAACLYALTHHVERLAEDHQRASALAKALASVEEVRVLSHATNMVFVDIAEDKVGALTAFLQKHDVLISATYGGPTRLVTHLDITNAHVTTLVDLFKQFFTSSDQLIR